MGYVIIGLLIIVSFRVLISCTQDWKYTKKLNNLFYIENNPLEAFKFIEKEMKKSKLVVSEHRMVGKYYALIWIGDWNEANRILKWLLQKKKFKRVYRIYYYKLLLGFFTQEYDSVIESYSSFMDIEALKINGIYEIEFRIIECLYSFHIEKNYTKCIETFIEIQSKKLNVVLYLAMLYYYVGQAKLELGEIEESISYFSKAMIFGQHTFFKEKARNMLMKIKDEASEQNRKEIIDAIECSINEAHVQLEEQVKERVEMINKQKKKQSK